MQKAAGGGPVAFSVVFRYKSRQNLLWALSILNCDTVLPCYAGVNCLLLGSVAILLLFYATENR